MKFVDEVRIITQSGRGGAGAVSFRREKYVPLGGPNGGDGGRGGHVILRANPNMSTLFPLRHRRHIRAEHGHKGGNANRTGRNGEDTYIDVPPGTLIFNDDDDSLLIDLDQPDQTHIAANGGRGGKGNSFFKSNSNRAPRMSQPGEDGAQLNLRLELKLLADVGLVGMPNAGKSTLISRISAAQPKIADYPFTTLTPNLGMVVLDHNRSFVIADIPGLIEGAAEGKGLGNQFLKHIERSRALCFLIDAASEEPESWTKTLLALQDELRRHNPELVLRASMAVLNKIDALDEEGRAAAEAWRPDTGETALTIHLISAVSGEGLNPLVEAMHRAVTQAGKPPETDMAPREE